MKCDYIKNGFKKSTKIAQSEVIHYNNMMRHENYKNKINSNDIDR